MGTSAQIKAVSVQNSFKYTKNIRIKHVSACQGVVLHGNRHIWSPGERGANQTEEIPSKKLDASIGVSDSFKAPTRHVPFHTPHVWSMDKQRAGS